MQCNQKEILDFLNFHYKVETLGEDSFDLNLEGNPSSYLTFYSDKIFEGEGSIFYRDFFNLEEPFNCFFMNPENQIRFDKSSPLGPLIKKIVDDKIPAFFERVSLKKYEERDRFDLEGNPANIYLLNSILLK